MFCSQCGAKAAGRFCAECGARLTSAARPIEPNEPADVGGDWSNQIEYATLLRYADVRDQIDRAAAGAKKGLSGEEFLALADKILPMGVPLEKLGALVQPLGARLGIKTTKQKSKTSPLPAGKTIVAVLCSLARNGWKLRDVRQFADGCRFEAVVPSDMFAFEGTIVVAVRVAGGAVFVEAAAEIKGQIFDWGKNNRCLNSLFADVARAA